MSVEVKLNSDGFKALLTSPEMAALVSELAEGVATKAGDGFEASVFTGGFGGGRVVGVVRTATNEAREAEATSMALTRAVNS